MKKPALKLFLGAAAVSLTVAVLFTPQARSLAQDLWSYYQSRTGVVSVRMPDKRSTKVSTFLVADKKLVHAEETVSVLDQRPYKNIVKTYIVKYEQTIGKPLSHEEISALLYSQFDLYEGYYKDLGGIIKSKGLNSKNMAPGGEILISFNDPEFGQQFFRNRFLYSGTTQLQQIVIGPEEILNAYKTRDFYDTMGFNGGVSITKDTQREKWVPFNSPYNIFTVRVPPDIVPDYYPIRPVVKASHKSEIVSLLFRDPLRNQSMYFNIYGYKFEQPMTPSDARKVLMVRHVSKVIKDPKTLKTASFKQDATEDGSIVLDGVFNIRPLPGYPGVRAVRLRAEFQGNVMIVKESLGSSVLISSPFVDTIFGLIDFHPMELLPTPTGNPAFKPSEELMKGAKMAEGEEDIAPLPMLPAVLQHGEAAASPTSENPPAAGAPVEKLDPVPAPETPEEDSEKNSEAAGEEPPQSLIPKDILLKNVPPENRVEKDKPATAASPDAPATPLPADPAAAPAPAEPAPGNH